MLKTDFWHISAPGGISCTHVPVYLLKQLLSSFCLLSFSWASQAHPSQALPVSQPLAGRQVCLSADNTPQLFLPEKPGPARSWGMQMETQPLQKCVLA